MSASTERKQRQAARAAGTDKKTIAMQEEAKKKAKSKRRYTIAVICAVLFIILVLVMNSNLMNTATTALTVGGKSFSPAEVTYNYAGDYYSWANTYGSYASIFGLDTSYGLSGLASQECQMTESGEGTWKDYFIEQAESSLQQLVALEKYADENGISLDEEEIAEVEESFASLNDTAKSYGYANANKFLSANYGKGVTVAIAEKMEKLSSLASKAYNALSDSYEFTDAEIEEYYEANKDDYDTFSYVYCQINAETEEVEGEDGEVTEEVTDATLETAKAAADAVAEAVKGSADGSYSEKLAAALAEAGIDAEPVEQSDYSGSYVYGIYADWLKDTSRETGDVTVCENSGNTGYYVVIFIDRGDNNYNLANVRHILIEAEADENGEYTEEALAAAKAKAEEILAEWEAGDANEESFAELAETYSEDSGSNTNGGLYENVEKGSMVEEFNDFCFAPDRKAGDTGIVYGNNGSYAGYHVMYYSGDGDLARTSIAKSDMTSEKVSAWLTENAEAQEVIEKAFFNLVGKI